MRERMIFFVLLGMFFLCAIGGGCAESLSMTTREGTIKVGMTKAEILAIWGEPDLKHLFEEDSKTYERWELWRYPRKTWWAAHGVDLAFNRDGVLSSIEPLYK